MYREGAMVWGEASWLSRTGTSQTGSYRNLKLDPPTDSSRTSDSLGCWEVHDDRRNVAMVLLWTPGWGVKGMVVGEAHAV